MAKKYLITEIFGPTIQGEGVDQGVPCYFIRTGGCDFRCEWCDTPFAVLPRMVKACSKKMTIDEIMAEVKELAPGPRWVVLSGGNPLMQDLTDLVLTLHERKFRIAVETQASMEKEWMYHVDRLCLSPKPPSAGMGGTDFELLTKIIKKSQLVKFWDPITFLKVVVFDQLDFDYAKVVHSMFPDTPMCVSAGNDAGATVGNPDRLDTRSDDQIKRDLIDRGRWLANMTMIDPIMQDVRVQMQQHVLYWANAQGV